MTALDTLNEIVSLLVGGLKSLGTGIAEGVSNFVTGLMYSGSGDSQTLSPFFVVVCIFGGVALAISLTTLIFNWIKSLGGN